MPITNPEEIRLTRQNELEAIIGNPPGWSLRWGISVFFVCIALLLGISWFVNYPDIVVAPVVLTTQNPPIRLVAGASAEIVSLKTTNGAIVKRGDILGILNNPANTEDIFQLEHFLEALSENDPSTYLSINLPRDLKLGNLQSDYAQFSQNFEDLQYFLKQDINFQKISNLRKQIVEIEKLAASLQRQISLFEKELVLSQNGVTRDCTLYLQGSLSVLDFENTRSTHLIKSRQLERLRSELASNQLRIQELQSLILDLRQKQSDNQNERLLAIKSDIQRLQGALAEWKKTWLLMAPINGEVTLTNAWSEHQFVTAGEEVLTIVPLESAGNVVAKAQIKGASSGKIQEDMEAHIRLEGFPYQEFGELEGRISHIANVPGKNGYEAEIVFPNGLVTSYHKALEFQQEMEGTARIVTEERNLLTRIFEKIRAAFEQ